MSYFKPLINIIVPVYNVQKFIKRAIESLKHQTFENFEAIIVNDGSKDNSINVAKEITGGDSRFVFIEQSNLGLGAARNRGIDISKAKYLAFLDSDDYYDIHFLEKMYEKIVYEKSDICICDVDLVEEDSSYILTRKNNYRNTISGVEAFKDETQSISILSIAPGKLYKRALFLDIRYPIGLFYEDRATTYKLLLKAKKVCFVNESLFYYRQRPNSITKSIDQTKIDHKFIVLHHMENYLDKKHILEQYINEYKVCYLMNLLLACSTQLAMYSNDYIKQEKNLLNRIDKNIFTLKNILLLKRTNFRKMLALVLLKICPRLFRILAVMEKSKTSPPPRF